MFYNILLGILATQIYGFLYPVEYTFIKNNVTKNINNFFENYKEELNPSIMCVGYNLLYFCSFTQIKYNKTKYFINKHIGSKLSILWLALINFLIENKLIENKPTINVISIYKDGLLINEIITNTVYLADIAGCQLTNKDNYDLIIFTDKKNDCEKFNKIHYTELPPILNDYKISNIRFFTVELEYKDEIYFIELINEKDNYYIVNNVLNKDFFKYYLTSVLNKEIDNCLFEYKLLVIDHNANMVELTHNDWIIIKENDYEINIKIMDEFNDESNAEFNDELNEKKEDTDRSDNSDDYVKFD